MGEGALDRFILARLEKEGLQPSPEADKHTLLRRVTFDLTGLPPSPEEIDAFVADESENAYEKVVDRLLASPHYGEQVASYWLDAARYADTDGYQNDRIRYMWVWRDWVIRALNDNMPFDRFILEQMAGDLLPDRNFMTQVASGYNRNHRINSEGGSIPDEWIVEYVADRVETLGTTFLGLTMNCARCHDHKYDAVSQKDFYSLFAFFNGIDEAGLGPNNGNSPPFVPVPKSWPDLKPGENKFVVPEKMKIKVVQTSVPRPQPGGANTVMVMHELPKPRPTYLLERGQYERPDKSQELQPGVPEVIGGWKKVAEKPDWVSQLAHRSCPPAYRTGNRQPALAKIVRLGLGQDVGKLRSSGGAPEPSRTTRLVGQRIHRRRVGSQGNLQDARDLGRLSSIFRKSLGFGPRQPAFVQRTEASSSGLCDQGFRLGFRRFAGP